MAFPCGKNVWKMWYRWQPVAMQRHDYTAEMVLERTTFSSRTEDCYSLTCAPCNDTHRSLSWLELKIHKRFLFPCHPFACDLKYFKYLFIHIFLFCVFSPVLEFWHWCAQVFSSVYYLLTAHGSTLKFEIRLLLLDIAETLTYLLTRSQCLSQSIRQLLWEVKAHGSPRSWVHGELCLWYVTVLFPVCCVRCLMHWRIMKKISHLPKAH